MNDLLIHNVEEKLKKEFREVKARSCCGRCADNQKIPESRKNL